MTYGPRNTRGTVTIFIVSSQYHFSKSSSTGFRELKLSQEPAQSVLPLPAFHNLTIQRAAQVRKARLPSFWGPDVLWTNTEHKAITGGNDPPPPAGKALS